MKYAPMMIICFLHSSYFLYPKETQLKKLELSKLSIKQIDMVNDLNSS